MEQELLKPENFVKELATLGTNGIKTFEKLLFEKTLNNEDMETVYYAIMTPYVFKDGKSILISTQIVELYESMDRKLLNEEIKKFDWMKQVIKYCSAFYGIWNFEVFYEVYSKNYKLNVSRNELLKLYEFLPKHISKSVYESGCFYADDVIEEDKVSYYHSKQLNKPYRIPTLSEIKEFDKKEYLSNVHVQSFIKYLKKTYRMTNDEIDDCLIDLQYRLIYGADFTNIVNIISKQFSFDSKKDIEVMITHLQSVCNNIRIRENRGHSPLELRKVSKINDGPVTIVPGSTKAAEMLKEVQAELNNKNIKIDIGGDSQIVSAVNQKNVLSLHKVYPNDPCPCGSGIPYRLCHERSK